MKKAQTVFLNDKPLVFFYVYNSPLPSAFEGFTILNEESSSLEEAIDLLEKSKTKGAVFMSENVEESWKRFVKKYVLIEAAGGLVRNVNGELLFIFRNGKWDLPKGKAEYEETPEETALREVEEECGIRNLKIEKELSPTFHTYKEKGKLILKKTHWFEMSSTDDKKLTPQLEEGITEVKWVKEAELKKVVLKNTFASVRGIFEAKLNL